LFNEVQVLFGSTSNTLPRMGIPGGEGISEDMAKMGYRGIVQTEKRER
jgi:hypothetical protein